MTTSNKEITHKDPPECAGNGFV